MKMSIGKVNHPESRTPNVTYINWKLKILLHVSRRLATLLTLTVQAVWTDRDLTMIRAGTTASGHMAATDTWTVLLCVYEGMLASEGRRWRKCRRQMGQLNNF